MGRSHGFNRQESVYDFTTDKKGDEEREDLKIPGAFKSS